MLVNLRVVPKPLVETIDCKFIVVVFRGPEPLAAFTRRDYAELYIQFILQSGYKRTDFEIREVA